MGKLGLGVAAAAVVDVSVAVMARKDCLLCVAVRMVGAVKASVVAVASRAEAINVKRLQCCCSIIIVIFVDANET